ncbi:hypothetical protein [Methylobacter tundripaludum]|uniref:hypothetical protein n=1 Tax=Methylobacter tundripaludum TaxID=173365 RepID=UPI0004DF6230|nr:hypothetical protein [Methylobacter tundripaludum]
MINIKHGVPGQGMTYSQRRRLINLLWAFVSNSAFPFIIGFVFALFSITYSFTGMAKAFDKSGFGTCIQPDLQENNAITGAFLTPAPPSPSCKTAETFAVEQGGTNV